MIKATRDAALLARLHTDAMDNAWPVAQWAALLDNPVNQALVAETEAEPKGFIAFSAILDEIEVLTIAVAPGARRKGLGAMLLRAALIEAERAFLEVDADNAAAIGLYLKEGFTKVGARRDYYGLGRDALALAWTRAPA
jgi:ribosomal-protein-alanine N-acetyltransferase